MVRRRFFYNIDQDFFTNDINSLSVGIVRLMPSPQTITEPTILGYRERSVWKKSCNHWVFWGDVSLDPLGSKYVED